MARPDDGPGGETLPDQETHLFVLRVWARPDAAGAAGRQWGGKVQQILGGRAGYFGSWPALVDLIQSMLPGPAPEAAGAAADPPPPDPARPDATAQ